MESVEVDEVQNKGLGMDSSGLGVEDVISDQAKTYMDQSRSWDIGATETE